MLMIMIVLAVLAGSLVCPEAGLGVLLVGIFNVLDDIRGYLRRAYPSPQDIAEQKHREEKDRMEAQARAERIAAVEKERDAIAEKKAAREAPTDPRLRCPRCTSPMKIEETRCPTCQHIRQQPARTP